MAEKKWWRRRRDAESPQPEVSSEPEPERGFVILARSDEYEGFERPGLGDEVAADQAARAYELEVAEDLDGLRQLLSEIAGTGYDLVAVAGRFGGWQWEFRGFDVVDQQGRSALLHRAGSDFEDRISPHGLFWNQSDAQAFLEATGAKELIPMAHYRRSGIRPGQALWYSIGNEFNPGNPFGRAVVTIDDAGRVEFELHGIHGAGSWSGELVPGVMDEIRAGFARGNFPHRSPEPLPAGATTHEIELFTDGTPVAASIYEPRGRETEGYLAAFTMLNAIGAQISDGAYRGGETDRPPYVTNVRKLD